MLLLGLARRVRKKGGNSLPPTVPTGTMQEAQKSDAEPRAVLLALLGGPALSHGLGLVWFA